MRTRLPVGIFLVWTFVVWVGRIRNIVADDELSAGGRIWRLGAAFVFLVLAAAVPLARRAGGSRSNVVLGVLVAWTVGWWLVRGIGIVLDDHDLGFTVVHTVLMIVSILLAMWAWRRRGG
jgi:hypothetical protein